MPIPGWRRWLRRNAQSSRRQPVRYRRGSVRGARPERRSRRFGRTGSAGRSDRWSPTPPGPPLSRRPTVPGDWPLRRPRPAARPRGYRCGRARPARRAGRSRRLSTPLRSRGRRSSPAPRQRPGWRSRRSAAGRRTGRSRTAWRPPEPESARRRPGQRYQGSTGIRSTGTRSERIPGRRGSNRPPGPSGDRRGPQLRRRRPGLLCGCWGRWSRRRCSGCADSPRAVRSGDPARLRARVAVSLAGLDCDGPALVEDPASPEASESAAASGSPAITPPTPSATARAPTRPT